MEQSRPSPVHWIAVIAGLALAAVGVVRFAQGRPERRVVAAVTPTAVVAESAPPTTEHNMEASASTSASATTVAAADGGATANGDMKVNIVNFTFAPDPVTVSVGTKVTWTNSDTFAHTATSDDGTTFDSGNLDKGQSFSFTFTTAGTYMYKCSIHNSMTGVIVVK